MLDPDIPQTEDVELRLIDNIGGPPDVLMVYLRFPTTPDAVRWIIVLLRNHTRRAKVNGQLSASWKVLSGIFQGCVWAPGGYAIGAEAEGRAYLLPTRPCTKCAL